MNRKALPGRWFVFITGLFIMSFGVALSVKADLGISPISCVPYVFSLKYSLTLGQLTVIFNSLLILLQILILRKRYRIFQLIQLPVIFLFGIFIDLALYLTAGFSMENYLVRLLLCLASCVVIGIGVFLEVRAGITYLPGEGLALAVSEALGIDFGRAKTGTDSAMVILGIISSIVLLQSLQGIREGTLISALLIGFIARTLVLIPIPGKAEQSGT